MLCEPWFCVGLGWLPIMVGLTLSSAIILPYCIAVGMGHIEAGFPYISDAGTLPPESCVFGQLLNITAALVFGTMYVRYKQVEEYHSNNSSPAIRSLNRICIVLGTLASIGLSLVANFQETNVLLVHFLGALMCFGLGTIYAFGNSYITYKMLPHHSSSFVYKMRLVLSMLMAVFFIFGILKFIFGSRLESNVVLVHTLGAVLCFGLGTIYGFANSYITYKMLPHHSSSFVYKMRLILSSLMAVFLILYPLPHAVPETPVLAYRRPRSLRDLLESNVILVHFLGAMLCFVLGTIYGFANSYITYKMLPHHSTKFVYMMRLLISSLMTVFIIFLVMAFTAKAESIHNKEYPDKKIYEWTSDMDGFGYHLVATTTEWCLGLSFIAYFFTFIREFQKLDLITEVKRSYRYTPIPGDNISALLT